MGAVEAEIERFWREDYAAAFMAKDPVAYAANFALPCLICAEGIDRSVFTTREALVAYCTRLIETAKDTRWETSAIDGLSVHVLDDAVATVQVEATRFDAAGEKVSRLYGNYTVNKEGGVWRMAAIFGGFLDA